MRVYIPGRCFTGSSPRSTRMEESEYDLPIVPKVFAERLDRDAVQAKGCPEKAAILIVRDLRYQVS
ncbi:hypothetical protein SKTS_09340 [Sulfurimicrobium lacus]|uniref:Uncharacterized protein n=1 Tax=Sulfurimicrobium lacus TaxID=2715678 RepID=A0A6F8V8N0_9PROT|nr:hypothetical protein SKTS_09340 [Sulfurimicrobium lacus]